MGDALGRGLQVGEMYESAESLEGALNTKGGEGGLQELEVVNCDVSLWPYTQILKGAKCVVKC